MTNFTDTTKAKDLALAIIDANESATKSYISALNQFVGSEYATYTYGLTYVASEITKNARKIVEEFADLAPAGTKG